ncbi:TetR/AcrR family transcriptional regulator [Terrarubrum flagellatum]|uniref:TetR/AcrR family transcriptional regulator n=1 Tax=Terrirubrum flagellatum TaxID=2895980 RepID=UPI0031450DB5
MPKITPDRQTKRRDRILDAAERCFARSGFQGATIAEICADAGVSAGGAYLYFKSKEDLIAGITERDRERIAVDFMRLGDAPDFLAALDGMAQHYLIDEPLYRRVLFMEIAAAATRNPAVAEQWRRIDRVIREVFKKALATQIAAGRIKPLYDLDTLAAMMMVIGDGMCQRITLDPDFDQATAVPVMMTLVRQLLGVDEAPVSETPDKPAAHRLEQPTPDKPAAANAAATV